MWLIIRKICEPRDTALRQADFSFRSFLSVDSLKDGNSGSATLERCILLLPFGGGTCCNVIRGIFGNNLITRSVLQIFNSKYR